MLLRSKNYDARCEINFSGFVIKIFSSTPCPQTPSICALPLLRDQVSHIHKTMRKTMVGFLGAPPNLWVWVSSKETKWKKLLVRFSKIRFTLISAPNEQNCNHIYKIVKCSRLCQSTETTPEHFRYLRKKGVAQSYSKPGTLRAIEMTRHILKGWRKTWLILCELHHQHQEGICLRAMYFFSPPCHNSLHNTSYKLHVTQLVVSL